MNRTCLLNAALLLAIPVAVLAQSASQTTSSFAPMSKHELQPLIKSAHSSAEYKQLAAYYHHSQSAFTMPLQAEVNVDSRDIGEVAVGQPVRLKFEAFPFQNMARLRVQCAS